MARNSCTVGLAHWSICMLVVATGLLAQGRGNFPAFQGNSITAPRPLSYIADTLEARYGQAITYEDPVWNWQGDLEIAKGWAVPFFVPRSFTATLPANLNPTDTPTLDAAALNEVLVDYDSRNDGPRYRILRSNYGLHIVPTMVRDAGGRLVESRNPMDTVVSIPIAKRAPSGHLNAICDALARKLGRRIQCFAPSVRDDWYKRTFAAPGDTLEWGAASMSARDALMDLFGHSATTFTWRFKCAGDPGLVTVGCTLNLHRIEVATGDRSRILVSEGYPAATKPLEYDRCPDCRPALKK